MAAARSWEEELAGAGVSAGMIQKLLEDGHDSAETFRENVPSSEVLEQLLEYYLVGEGRAADISEKVKSANFRFSSSAGMVRKLWRSLQEKATSEKLADQQEAPPSSTKLAELDAARAASEAAMKAAEAQLALVQASVSGSGQASLVPFGMGKSKRAIDTLEREKMKQEAEKKFTGLKIVHQDLPSVMYLQAIVNQNDAFVWTPWKKIMSEDKEKDVMARRGNKKELLDLMAESAGIWELEWDGSQFNSPHSIQNVLYTRAHAYCMAGKSHFGSWSVYIKKFIAEYTNHPPLNLGLRSPNGLEAEEADRAAMTKIFDLCLSQDGWSLDDAIWEVVENRSFLGQVLGHRRKEHKAQQDGGRRRQRERLESARQLPESESPPPLKRSRKGKGSGKGGKGDKKKGFERLR
jgi:hypothetical protein